MSKEDFIAFEKFNNQILALELGTVLKENDIAYEYENVPLSFDVSFAVNELRREFSIKLKQADFEKARLLLEEIWRNQIVNVSPNYYLFDFSDSELLEIIHKRDEWGHFDYVLARDILKKRSLHLSPEVIDTLKTKRIKELSIPEKSQKIWIYIGYILAFLGGILGLIIGWHLVNHKKALPNGDKVPYFSESDRKDGNSIVSISIVCTILWLAFRIYRVIP